MDPIFNAIAKILGEILVFINNAVGDYGVAIILLTLLLKVVLLPSSLNTHKFTEKQRALQPRLKEIQEKYKDKPQELQAKQMALYKEVGMNPLSGCLPLLIQFPIFIAFFTLLRNPETFGLAVQDASFLGLNLSAFVKDQGTAVLVAVVGFSGLTTYWQQAMVMTDNSQKMFMYIMPLFFAYITATVPGGLALYWLANNVFTIAQQYALSYYFKKGAKGETPADEGNRKN